MPVVVGVRFKDSGKTYYFDPRDLELIQGDPVIVETVRGLELAKVAYARHEVEDSDIVGDLKPVVRRAEDADIERQRLLQSRHEEVIARCAEKISDHGLPMSLVKAEYSFDGSRLTFYFTAEKRVDFRMLVRDLARTFKSRIELRQIGPRDEAKLLGGIGPCGRVLCCASFLPDYARVSIKMAKDQDLPLNPSKISGVCGRLLCCLSYEHDQYVELRSILPKKGSWVQTPDGPGEVSGHLVLKQQALVQLAGSGMIETYDLSQLELATRQVIAAVQERNAAGVTPAAQSRQRDRGERRMLRDEIDQYDLLDELGTISEEEAPPRGNRSLRRQDGGALGARPPKAPPAKPAKPVQRSAAPEPSAQPDRQQPAPPSDSVRRRRRRRGRGDKATDKE
jgi:cell fate regulator YaaT (PSP1 superfamily)